jgi:hypothetical protein
MTVSATFAVSGCVCCKAAGICAAKRTVVIQQVRAAALPSRVKACSALERLGLVTAVGCKQSVCEQLLVQPALLVCELAAIGWCRGGFFGFVGRCMLQHWQGPICVEYEAALIHVVAYRWVLCSLICRGIWGAV